LPTDKVYAETLYYVVGFLLCAATKEARRRREKMALNLKFLVASASIEKDNIDNARTMLPTGKVDRINEFGGLHHPTKEFYEVVASWEYMFVKCLTNVNLLLQGRNLVYDIVAKLQSNPSIRQKFRTMLPDDSNDGELDEVLSYLLRTFGRVKGKDYVRKLMSRSKASLLVGTRPGLAVTSLTARVKAEKEHRKDMVAAEEENNAMRAVIRELFDEEEDSA
jgi:uncharacterized membrane-anchored protein YjiN (DUF445 family)